MNKKFQKIFKRSAVERIRLDLRDGKSLESYFSLRYPINNQDVILSTIEISGSTPKLKTPKDLASADLENAIAIHEHYKNIDETQASDPRLWTYVSHVEFRIYSLARWGLPESFQNSSDPVIQKRAINQIIDHWFTAGNDRDLRRHAVARLWWAAHLTYSPWESDPEFFGNLKNKDPYYYTGVLLSSQDIYQQILERGMGRSNRILISILDLIDKNKEIAYSREKIRTLIKELNLVYGSKKIIALNNASLGSLISNIATRTK